MSFYATKYFSNYKQFKYFSHFQRNDACKESLFLSSSSICNCVTCMHYHDNISVHCLLVLTNIHCTMFDSLFYVDAVVNITFIHNYTCMCVLRFTCHQQL